ncbi:MAG: hypothetical protein M1821_007771 [Bathelium mastoideum]|nr:MAG: hypothetical protein M1821_007771 [Bathelium mastoideum]
MSPISDASDSPSSVFDQDNELENEIKDPAPTDPTTLDLTPADEIQAYDLKPPPPSVSQSNVESLSDRLFSSDHLKAILQDQAQAARFNAFLRTYRLQDEPLLARYLESQKAAKAVEYANAIAHGMGPTLGHDQQAAHLDSKFEARSRRIEDELVEEIMPGYITHRLVQLVTECLVKEITGNNVPIMREMVSGLAEVYCLSDPSLPDNPLVYASEEFYRTTQYGKDYVIGRNCRFLQGPKTQPAATKRIVEAIALGQEVCETILNYRRDGSPFMNLVMIAPLYDNKGNVRYFIGCQIDVSNLVVGGRGLESFEHLLAQDKVEARFGGQPQKNSLAAVGELSQLMTNEEVDVVKKRDRSYSHGSESSTPVRPGTRDGAKPQRRILGMESAQERSLWANPQYGSSGRLPGVYQNFLLVRPWPSLRITFTSPALRIPGLMQSKFLDRIGGPQHVREEILDSLSHGISVTAKISWLTNAQAQSRSNRPHQHSDDSGYGDDYDLAGSRNTFEGKPRWIHCTPLLGSDEKVGVWMVVMVESEEYTGQLNVLSKLNMNNPYHETSATGSPSLGAASARYTGNKLYAEYLRREGKDGGSLQGGSLKGLDRGRANGSGGGGSKLSSKRSDSLVGRGRAMDRMSERPGQNKMKELNSEFREED